MLRRIALVAAALLAAVSGPLTVQRALAGQSAGDLRAMTNADRAAKGLKALASAGDLQSVAQKRADDMARSGRLAHSTGLGSKVSGWKRLGENVGRGPTLQEIQAAFMASPSHRQNILDPGFTQVGVGVTFDGKEYLYVAVIFREPSGATAAIDPPQTTQPRPRPATPPTTRAASAPRPKPKPTTTTQAPPTTTTTETPTTTTTAPPPPPPVEPVVAVPPVEPPPETTTTTAPRPIFADPDFLAANFSDGFVPVAAKSPLPAPGRSATPFLLACALGLVVGAVCVAAATLRPVQLPEFSRRRHWR